MGYFKKIILSNFRNFEIYENEFSKNCNVFYGKNGSGKTNILESISLFGKGRGIRNDQLHNLIKTSAQNFLNIGNLIIDQEYNIEVSSKKLNNKFFKKISINKDSSKNTLDHFNSLISFLVFLPEMDRLFLISPSYRRNFIDRFIYSEEKDYNELVNKYKKNINERNKLLMSNRCDEEWISKIEEDIAVLGLKIYKFRLSKIDVLQKNINRLNVNEKLPYSITIQYIDKFYNNNTDTGFYKSQLKINREVDRLIGGSKIGPHKSDFMCYVKDSIPANQLSTGQQKTLVLLLILAQCKHLVSDCKINPIILMDEVCSHLDEINRSILLKITEEFDLQIFMTGTEKKFFSFLSTNNNYYNITS